MVFCLSLAFTVGCGGGGDSTPDTGSNDVITEPEVLNTVRLNVVDNLKDPMQSNRAFRTIGRTFERSGYIACDLSCTGVKFNVLCKGDVKVKFYTTSDCFFTLYVDGERQEGRIALNNQNSGDFITVASFAEYGQREISLVKQSQYPMAYSGISEVEITGSFGKRPANKERFIEFYGDSILNGSNIYTGGTSTLTSDATLAFGYLTALALNADCNIIGRGGMGIYAKDDKTDGMVEIWDLCGGTDSPDVVNYDFGRMPDCVVVELGSNDAVSQHYTDKRYANSVKEMVFNIRSVYGDDIKIVWCHGYSPNANSIWSVAKETLDGLNANGNILFCEIPLCGLDKSLGGDGLHPDVEKSKEVAGFLTEFILENVY